MKQLVELARLWEDGTWDTELVMVPLGEVEKGDGAIQAWANWEHAQDGPRDVVCYCVFNMNPEPKE